MAKVTVKWDGNGLSDFFKSDGMQAALLEHANSLVPECDENLRKHLHSPMRKPLCKAGVRVARHTALGVIHPVTNAGAGIARKYGMRR